MENKIQHKVIVITGASSGAGKAMALELSRGKASLVLAARNEAALAELAKECEELGADTLVVPTDVTDHLAMRELAKQASEWKGRIDVWVNNAGILAAGVFDETPWPVHQQVITTNLLGYMSGAYAVLPYMKQQRSGTIINNISIGAYLPVPFGGAYSASKFALRGFFESLRGELADWPGIHIVDLFPSFLDTPGVQHAGNYTGKVIKPAPPVFDPALVAKAVRASIIQPKSSRYPDAASIFFKLGHALAPELTVKLTALLMKGYFSKAKPAEITDGNLFSTVNYGMAPRGNARFRLKPSTRKYLTAGLLLAGAGLATMLLTSDKKKVA
jgi:short-subunit dehydrogenase